MDNDFVKQCSFSFKEILIDEIALEGLEGVGFDLLWRRIEKRLSIQVTEKMKARYWGFILYCEAISLYQIPEPLGYVEIKDRFQIIDQETGNLLDPPDYVDGPYEYSPVGNEYGSCMHYKTRKNISKDSLKDMPYENVVELYGDNLVMVASIEERWKAIAPHMPITYLKDMTKTHFNLLEIIGKGRENGQMTVGKTNLTKIIKDSKLLFYNRRYLQELDLIRVHSIPLLIGARSMKALFLRLKRFHQPILLTMPKIGKVNDVIQFLLKQPNYTTNCSTLINLGLVTQPDCRKLNRCENVFSFDLTQSAAKQKKIKKMTDKTVQLEPPSEDSSQSDDEVVEPRPCQYQVKVGLLRQAYERLLEAGLDGLSQVELSQILGVEYYAGRTICRTFKSKNLVKEIFVDKGKQRIARFVASASASAAGAKYDEERKKFYQLVEEIKKVIPFKPVKEEQDEPPTKIRKLDNLQQDIEIDSDVMNPKVTEINHLDGLQNLKQPFMGPGKDPTLRQLKYANGILKTLKEHVVVSGYMSLNHYASKSSNEPVMDGKCLKTIIQKLTREGLIKLLKMSWPVWQKSCILICAPNVQITDPIVQTKYKETALKMIRNRKLDDKEKLMSKKYHSKGKTDPLTKPLSLAVYPRYLKVQKLHEILVKHAYFPDDEENCVPQPGFSSLAEVIPEFTVEFVMGNMNSPALAAMYNIKVPQSMLQQKLRNVPSDLFKTFLATSTLQNAWRLNLKILAFLGLIQLIKCPSSSGEQNCALTYEYYVNRRTTIVDTTGDWPRDGADKRALEKTYYFETLQDVAKYWRDVYHISINTKIKIHSSERGRKNPLFYPRLREEVQLHDNGQVHGNGLGPCGFDASFFMDMPKLWMLSHTKYKSNNTVTKKPVKKVTLKTKQSKPKVPRPLASSAHRKPTAAVHVAKKRNRPANNMIPKWSTQEDRILMLCKAALTVISSAPQVGCLRLRNLTAKDILTLFDPKKTAGWCHKRLKTIESNTVLTYEKDCVINELRRHPQIIKKYEAMFKIFKQQFCGNISKLLNASRLPMLELVMLMLRIMRSGVINQKVPCVAMNLEEFHNNYTICSSTVNNNYDSYKTASEDGPTLAAIKEAVVLSVMTSHRRSQSPESGRLIHAMFSAHSEQMLRLAVEQLRKCGAIAARDKNFINASTCFQFQDIAQSFYKLSTGYMRHWICRLNSEFADNLMFSLDEDLPKQGLKGSPEINCMLFESQASGVLEIFCVTSAVITGPEGSRLQQMQMSVSEMMCNYKIKPGSVGWVSKNTISKLSDLFENTDYSEALNEIIRASVLPEPPEDIDLENNIVSHLELKNKVGSTFTELQNVTGYDDKTLQQKIEKLESLNIVKRVGYYENLIVLTKFAKPWTMTISEKQIIPTPWLGLDRDVRNDVFLKWAGVIINKVFMKPGCSIAYLTDDKFLTPRAAQDICMVLEKYKCVTLKTIKVPEPDLFSEFTMPEIEEFCPYEAIENIVVFPVKDMLISYANFRKKLLDDEYYFEKT